MGEIRFVGTGETRGYPYPVCKNLSSVLSVVCLADPSVPILKMFNYYNVFPFFLRCMEYICTARVIFIILFASRTIIHP